MNGTCSLCRSPGELRNSHIISEFLYKPVYDPKHRFLETSTDPDRPIHLQQRGIREGLLCQKCETKRSVWETSSQELLQGLTYPHAQGSITIPGVDYAKFKLFQMSMLWLASVSTRHEFSAVDLGPYEEQVRQLLITEQPGRFNEYGCLVSYPPDKHVHELFRQAIMPADMIIAGGHHLFRFLVGGLFWVFFVSNRMTQLKDAQISLSEQGQLRIYNGGPHLMKYLHRFARDISANPRNGAAADRFGA